MPLRTIPLALVAAAMTMSCERAGGSAGDGTVWESLRPPEWTPSDPD
jgi:hypothetical protein